MDRKQLDQIFMYHPPFGTQPQRFLELRSNAKRLASMINAHCPESREKALAITSVQQCIMWANAAIAINEVENGSDETNR